MFFQRLPIAFGGICVTICQWIMCRLWWELSPDSAVSFSSNQVFRVFQLIAFKLSFSLWCPREKVWSPHRRSWWWRPKEFTLKHLTSMNQVARNTTLNQFCQTFYNMGPLRARNWREDECLQIKECNVTFLLQIHTWRSTWCKTARGWRRRRRQSRRTPSTLTTTSPLALKSRLNKSRYVLTRSHENLEFSKS